ncbi:uncharacterized protein N7482_004723 [Penicillium canariense]|uniref:Uncharacterized protein n=1 Tax=Penicillium canariense TaxID=189055 RepID=A0A9W9I974_9EURO|nr:uncharacterized protein N7482_004723 [Penicillium canariense]KAJ5169129.1 hypothetical protein N7482_004723 [Penicillium canariense]
MIAGGTPSTALRRPSLSSYPPPTSKRARPSASSYHALGSKGLSQTDGETKGRDFQDSLLQTPLSLLPLLNCNSRATLPTLD